jgi:tetratricopeptide (TPR) repeat protein
MLRLLLLLALRACAADEAPVGADGGTPAPTPPPPRAPADAAKLLAAGERAFREKTHEVAVRLFGEALAGAAAGDAALRARVLYARHKAFVSLAKLPAAIADLSAALEADARHPLALLMRANLNLMSGRCAEAAADYAAVLAADPAKRDAVSRAPHARDCAAALERADLGAARGDAALVRAALTEAMADGRATAAPALMLRRAEAALALGGEGDVEEALADLAKVIKMDGNNVRAYATRGRALLVHGDFATGEEGEARALARGRGAGSARALARARRRQRARARAHPAQPRLPLHSPPRSSRALPGGPQDRPRGARVQGRVQARQGARARARGGRRGAGGGRVGRGGGDV